MLIRQLRPWRPLVSGIITSTQPRSRSQILPRLPLWANRFSHHERVVKVSQASVLFEKARHATPENLIASIEPLSPSSIAGIEDSFEQAIFLFTPGFAQPLAYDVQFLDRVVNRLLEKLPDDHPNVRAALKRLDVAVAVVDRLPMPGRRHSKRLAVNDHGSEGMSYVVSTKSELNVANDTSRSAKPNPDETKTLSLRIGNAQAYDAADVHSQSTQTIMSQRFEIRTPLASTLFQVGQPSIMSLSSWEWREAEGRYKLQQESIESPSHISFSYPFVHGSTLSMPLVPLTQPRKIVAGMGNVIRQIAGNTESITASQELEPAVNSYFTAKELPPSAVNVWALVIPANSGFSSHTYRWLKARPGNKTPEELFRHEWQKECATPKFNWTSLFRRGVRLYRVLSGGGGWGKKAGLISLDPDSDFIETQSAELGAIFANNDLLETQESMLGDAAKLDDMVQFYICPSITDHHSLTTATHGLRLEIGVIPSTIDTIPLSEESQDGNEALLPGRVHHNLFGFMSEKGVSLAVLQSEADEKWIVQSRTKLSVPYTRLIFARSTKDLTFTSSEGKITPIIDERLPSETHEISPPHPTQSQKLPPYIRKYKTQAAGATGKRESIDWAGIQRLKMARGYMRLQHQRYLTKSAQMRRLKTLPVVPDHDSLPGGGVVIRKVKDRLSIRKQLLDLASPRRYHELYRLVPAEVKEDFARRLRIKFPLLNLRNIRQLANLYFGRKLKSPLVAELFRNPQPLSSAEGSTDLQKIYLPAEHETLPIRKYTSLPQSAALDERWKRRRDVRRRRETTRRRKVARREEGTQNKSHTDSVMPQTTSAWNLLQMRRRNRGKMGVKMRNKYEEGLETARAAADSRNTRAVHNKMSTWDRTWIAEGDVEVKKVETPEMRKEKREREEKEEQELLDTIKDLLKGF
ncbi:hypothetical protein FKW77_005404 [Venturia effusa]|uniref:Uncharacterized protein n=1 Tax=Venturia effusa TaxID=50376 RepID=A0A517LKF4_9PEZI|nr:hypothetical protein FKW77_005404 [Venturia effusa]